MNPRRLYRSRDRQLAGVAGGMAEYLNIDPTVARILWVLAAIFTGGLVILAYIVLALITPESPYAASAPAYAGWTQPGSSQPGYAQSGSTQPGAGASGWAVPPASPAWDPAWAARAAAQADAQPNPRGRGIGAAAIVGVVLIVIGGIALADAVLPAWSSAAVLGPAVILALGAALLVASLRRDDAAAAMPATPAGETAGPAAPTMSAPDSTAWAAAPSVADADTDTQSIGPIPLA